MADSRDDGTPKDYVEIKAVQKTGILDLGKALFKAATGSTEVIKSESNAPIGYESAQPSLVNKL